MSDKLAQAKKFSFKVERKLDAALVEGRNVPENAQIEISVSRPGKFLAKSDSQDNVRQFVFDGQNLSVYDETMKLYATVPVPGTIDEVVAKIDEKYGFTPPLAEFILSDPYRALSPRIKSQAYKGKETVDGVECHHLSLGGEVADSELWIGVADLLPRKLVGDVQKSRGRSATPSRLFRLESGCHARRQLFHLRGASRRGEGRDGNRGPDGRNRGKSGCRSKNNHISLRQRMRRKDHTI